MSAYLLVCFGLLLRSGQQGVCENLAGAVARRQDALRGCCQPFQRLHRMLFQDRAQQSRGWHDFYLSSLPYLQFMALVSLLRFTADLHIGVSLIYVVVLF